MRPGEKQLRDSLVNLRGAAPTGPKMPEPDDAWGAWVEYRLERLEDRQTWMTRLILGALLMQVGLQVLEMI